MADIKINPILTAPVSAPAGSPKTQSAEVKESFDGAGSARGAGETGKPQEVEKELEDVIAISKDGDTVQASEASKEKLEEDAFGRVLVNGETRQEQLRKESMEEQEKEEIKSAEARKDFIEEENKEDSQERYDTAQNNMTFSGYTDAQLEQMYLKGAISKNDYDHEMETREAKTEEAKEENSEVSERMTKLGGLAEEAERDATELEEAFSEDASDTLSGAERMAIISSLDNMGGDRSGADPMTGEENAKTVIVM